MIHSGHYEQGWNRVRQVKNFIFSKDNVSVIDFCFASGSHSALHGNNQEHMEGTFLTHLTGG